MSFSVEFKTANVFKYITEAVKDLTQTVVFVVSRKNGLYMQAMDSSAVSLCELRLPKHGFKSFIYEGEGEEVHVGIHVVAMGMVLKCLEGDKPVLLKYTSHFKDKICITDNDRFSFELNLVDISYNEMLELPDKIYKTKINVKSDFLKKLVSDIGEFGTCMTISFDGTVVRFQFTGGSFGVATTELRDVGSGVSLQGVLNVAIRYIRLFCKASALSVDLDIQLAQEEPVRFTYKIDSFENGTITFYLAPQQIL